MSIRDIFKKSLVNLRIYYGINMILCPKKINIVTCKTHGNL